MLNMNWKLEKREEEGKIIRTGIVGAGQMGSGMVTQMVLMKGITPAIVSDIQVQNAVNAFKYAGVKDEDIVIARTIADANAAMEAGKYVACEDAGFISQANLVKCAIDATGVPDVGAKVATDAMSNGKHVVMLNVETDVVIGPYLDKFAKDHGVIYTGSAGDEPGAVMELYCFAKDGLVSECITRAKIDLKAGQTIDGIGGYTTHGSICTEKEATEKGYVPFGLINKNARMKCDVKKGELITYDMVDLDTNTLIYKLRKEQDAMYGKNILK